MVPKLHGFTHKNVELSIVLFMLVKVIHKLNMDMAVATATTEWQGVNFQVGDF